MKGWVYLRAKHVEQLEYHRETDYICIHESVYSFDPEERGYETFESYELSGYKPMYLTPRQAIKIIKLKGFKINVDN